MSNELEDFLRRAAQRRAARQAQAAPPPSPQPQPQVRTIARPVQVQEIQYLEPVEAEIIAAEPVAKRHAVEQHVAQRLDTHQFAERASHLAERVGMADDDMESHLHAAFDHQVGKLASETTTQVVHRTDESALLKGLMATFRDATRVQQAVLLSEIMHRPEARW